MTQTIYNTIFDSTIDDIHQIREEISDKFKGDIQALIDDARLRQAASKRKTVSFADSLKQESA